YRKTIPPIARNQKIILISLRAIAISIILFVLFEPIYTKISTIKKSPQLAVLLDNSISLGASDASGSRKDRYKKLLSEIDFSKFGTNVKFYKFGETAEILENFSIDSLRLD